MFPGFPERVGDGRYELLDTVGSGGMAVVLRARDHHRGDLCAVKLLPSNTTNAKTRSRFRAEALAMRELGHPRVVPIRSVSEPEDPIDWFAMDLASGGSLAELVRRSGVRAPREALGYVLDALEGLAHAHARGVVHRDVKPHNMLLTEPSAPNASRSPVQLTDFGIARFLHTPSGSRITGTGDTLGTLAYMSPEQRANARNADETSDIYGIGATLYLLVTGRRPFDIAMAAQDPSVFRRLDPVVRDVVRRSTEADKANRYPSASEMADDIRGRLAA